MTVIFAVPHTVFLPGAEEYQHKASAGRIDSLPAADLPTAINLHLYHYAGNNPVRYTDPDGRFIFNDISNNSGNEVNYQNNIPNSSILGAGESVVSIDNQSVLFPMGKIILPNNLNTLLYKSYTYSNDNNPNT